ncbi:MAG TPA: hypothetical protein VF329_08040 [Gammaproteobacteria bacterium]
MNKSALSWIGLLVPIGAWGDDVSEADRLLCSVSRIMLCVETGECYEAEPWEADVPQFVVVDTQRKTISTTRASNEQRSTPIASYRREGGLIYLQGIEAGRAFSFVVDEATGLVTVAVSRDGLSVNVFGACTDSGVEAAIHR